MKTLIVHIEYDELTDPDGLVTPEEYVQQEVSGALEDLRDRTRCDIGWRYFSTLGEAETWEATGEYPPDTV